MNRCIPLLFVSMISLAACAGSVDEAAFLEWAKENAVSVDALERLDPVVAGKSVVFLGEPDHFIHEKNEYRTRMIRYLAGHGFTNIGMEMGVSDAIRMDAFLADGDPAHLDRVALYGFPDEQRTDRDDSIPGFTDDKHPEFDKAVESESRRFLASLRKINETDLKDRARLAWFGYDISFKPGGGYADIAAVLDRQEPSPQIDAFRSKLARVEGESRIEEAERLEALLPVVDSIAALGELERFEILRSLRCLAESYRFIEAARLKQGSRERIAGLVERETKMFRRMDNKLASLGEGGKIVLLGHDLHLSRNSTGLTMGTLPMWRSIGTHLAEADPEGVLAIWMLYDRGRHGNVHLDEPVQPVRSAPDAVERLLAKVGDEFLLPLNSGDPREEWLHRELPFMTHQGVRGVLPKHADVIYFVRTVTEPTASQQ